MNEQDWLAQRFEEYRIRLWAVAYRMLGSRAEADDAVQEAWLRLSRSDTSGVSAVRRTWLTPSPAVPGSPNRHSSTDPPGPYGRWAGSRASRSASQSRPGRSSRSR